MNENQHKYIQIFRTDESKHDNSINKQLRKSVVKKQLPLLTDAQITQPSSNFQIATQRSEIQRAGKMFVQKKNKLESNRIQRERECQSIYQTIVNQKVTQKFTLIDLFKNFLENFNQINNIKNEKYALNIILKLIQSIPKMQDVLDIHKSKFQGITSEQMIKQLIHHWLDQSIFQDYRKFKLDPIYITSIDEINKKFEETLLNLYDEQINSFSNRMINQIFSLKEKQFYIEGQVKLSNRGNQQLYQKTLQLIDRKPNYRALTSDVIERLQIQEEKLGKFDLIQNKERRKQMSLNLFVQKIRANSKYVDQ
ncbi:unnamed protein product [Paramecium sonneborni]|uniref:Uncharacterized protein n=1 Tax=Paramecium sonneborni TaxID=65129 RepID=A0A8S1MV93_9CILI|nr:unnamed protein product [Paramecium sonneborni]CAD8085009.1 unnamed protein product [Paramecium sonneborni]